MSQTIDDDLTVTGNLSVVGTTHSDGAIDSLQDVTAVNVVATGHGEFAEGVNDLQWATKQVPWNPDSIADEASLLYDLPWPEAEAGDFVLASFTGLGSHVRWLLGAHIPHDGGRVIVRLRNDTGNAFNPAAGVLNVLLIKWPGVVSWL